jgi:4-amino-4-deoxy-L-arabinose transferase-like glycosyltransferase
MTAPRDRRIELLLFVAVIGLAAFLRLYRLDLLDLRFDEASAPQLALSIARGNWLPVAPFSGSVANHPPVYLYLLALPYLITRDFMAIATYRALLDVLAVALTWWVCRRFFNLRVALIASLLFAVAPWAVQFARDTGIVVPPLFTTLLLFGLLEALQRRNPWGWAVAGWGLALSLGSHLTAVYLVPVVLIALVIGRASLRPVPVLVGIAPLLLVGGVYLAHDAGQGFANVRALLGSSGEAAWSLDALNQALWSTGGAHLSDLTSGAFPIWQAQVLQALNLIDTVQMAWLVVSAAILLVLLLRRSALYSPAAIVLLLLWLSVPVVLQLRHSRSMQMHYFLPLYPVPFIVMALGVDSVLVSSRTAHSSPTPRAVVPAVVATLVAIIVGWQVFTTQRFAAFIQQYDTSAGGYGPPVRSALDVAQVAREAIQSGEVDDVIIVALGGDPNVNEPATIFDVLLAEVPHRFANADAGLILREDAAQYIFTPGTERALAALMQDATGIITHEVRLREGSDKRYVYARAEQASLAPLIERPAQWANGVGLLGYRMTVSDAFGLETLVRVFREVEPGANYHWYSQGYAGDQKVTEKDSGGIHPANWRAGDILLHWFDLSPPTASPDRIRIGTYLYPQVQPIMIVDAAGNPIADGVDLPVATASGVKTPP